MAIDFSAKICGLCEDIKEMAVDKGTDLQMMYKAEEIIHEIRMKTCGWEHIWDAPDGTYKGRCRNCGFTHNFIEGHDRMYNYCPNCGDQKRIRKDGDGE